MTDSRSAVKDDKLVELLSLYFSQRGNFLAKVILADIVSSPFASLPNGSLPNGSRPHVKNDHDSHQNGGNGFATQIPSTKGNSGLQDAPSPAPMSPLTVGNGHAVQAPVAVAQQTPVSDAQLTPVPEAAPSFAVKAMLIELITEKTGFPVASIKPEFRLLDDLNLDSIKSAELVAQLAQQIGVEGQVDPAYFANATLAEVAEALEQLASAAKSGNTLEQPAVTVMESGNPSPKMLTLPVDESPAWVRNFVVEYVVEDAASISKQEEEWQNTNLFQTDDWKTAHVLIVAASDEADVVQEFSAALQQRGAKVQAVSFVEMSQRSLIQSPDFTHFIAIMPRDAQKGGTSSDRLQQAMEHVYAVATPLQASTAQREYTSVTYIQFGDGYFGKQDEINQIEQGCVIGFASTLHMERPDLKVRVIDIPKQTRPQALLEQVIVDIARSDAYLAAGYDASLTRRVPRPCLQDRTLYQNREIHWSADDVVLVTGGAKGITSECVLAFARVTGVKMVLLGSSPHPQEQPTGKSSPEIARTLRRFSDEGLTCRYYACDVADFEALKGVIERVETELGPVTGVIHGAAVNRARRVENCPVADALPEISPKVFGIFNLCQLFQAKPPKMMVGISSIGAVIGLPGNSWYSFSNEVLDLELRRFGKEHPETAVLSVAYSVWADVGMGARMGTVRNLNRMGIKAIPMEEGVDRFVQLMFNHPDDAQVVITSSLGGVQTLGRGFDTWRVKRVPPAASYRFIEKLQIIDPGIEITARTHLTLDHDSYVRDHIYKGSPLFPTVFGLEAMAQMVAYATGQESFSNLRIEDIRLERPIVVDAEKGVEIELRVQVLERESTGAKQRILAEIRTAQTGFAMPHFAATFVLGGKEDAPSLPIEYPSEPLDLNPKQNLYGSGLLFQGLRFQRLQHIYSLTSQQMVFSTQRGMPHPTPDQPFDRAEGPFILGDPYYRDSLLQSVQPMVPQDIGLPIGIKSIQIYQVDSLIAERCIGVASGQERNGKDYSTSVVATDESGYVIERLDGYTVRMIEHRPDNPTVEELGDSTERDERLLREELRLHAVALDVSEPEVSLDYVPDLHSLPADERHQKELPVFRNTVRLFVNMVGLSIIIGGGSMFFVLLMTVLEQ